MRRHEIVTLDQEDRQLLDQALSKMPAERIIRRLRHELHTGQQELHALRRASTISEDTARRAYDAFQARLHRLNQLPADLLDDDELAQACDPLHRGMQLCTQVLHELRSSTTTGLHAVT